MQDLLPPENTGEGRPSKPNRVMLNGMLWKVKTGAPWRDLPERFGPWKTVYSRFRLWSNDDLFQKVFESLTSDADLQDVSLDSTSCKVHQHAAGAKKGAENAETNQEIGLSRGGRNTKIHAVVDALGNPVRLFLTPGNIHDCTVAIEVLSDVTLSGSMVLADKAYGTQNIRTYIESQNATFCIPPKSNAADPWACDFHHYKERHVVECFFNKLKQFRGIATRYDKLSRNFLSFAFLASAMILLK
ncbi:IS5 family transposase [Paenibacillus durus]|uniref:IS5 family transposase n=1 Tax=Paenibacillus durus TaxID=44251 RepID=UPI0012E0748E|nr:IS5 family transposase [Paenibacillus durus]